MELNTPNLQILLSNSETRKRDQLSKFLKALALQGATMISMTTPEPNRPQPQLKAQITWAWEEEAWASISSNSSKVVVRALKLLIQCYQIKVIETCIISIKIMKKAWHHSGLVDCLWALGIKMSQAFLEEVIWVQLKVRMIQIIIHCLHYHKLEINKSIIQIISNNKNQVLTPISVFLKIQISSTNRMASATENNNESTFNWIMIHKT